MTAAVAEPIIVSTERTLEKDDTRIALWVVAGLVVAALIAVAGLAIGRWYGYARGEDAGRTAALEECAQGVEQNRAVQAVIENAVRAPRGSHVAVCIVKD